MWEFFQNSSVQAVLWGTALIMLVALGVYIVDRARGYTASADASTHDILTGFRDLEETGDLSSKEFQKIRSVMSEKIEHEAKES